MPIRVQGPDGSTVEFPDGTSKQVMARAMANKFGGPKNPPAPAPTTRAPRTPTARERGRALAASRDKTAILPDFVRGAMAGLNRGAFSLPDIAAAAATTGITKGANYLAELAGYKKPFREQSFSDQLEENRGVSDYEAEKSGVGNFLGELASGIVGGRGIVKGGSKLAEAALASRAVPQAAKTAVTAAKAVTALQKGQRVGNVARLAASGAAGGAAYAAGKGDNIGDAATVGAVASPAFVGVGKAAGYLARPFADMLGVTKAPALLKRFTNASMEDIQAAADRYRRDTGAEPTLFEILPLEDRKRLANEVVSNSAKTAEATATAVRNRLGNVGPEMARASRQATGPGRQRVVEQMASDIAEARRLGSGRNLPPNSRIAEPNRGVLPGGYGGDRSPADLTDFMRGESSARMASTEASPAADSLKDIFPTSLRTNPETGEIEEVFSDPEVNAAVISAAKGLRLRLSSDNAEADIAGLSAGDLTRVLRGLAGVQPGSPNKAAALRAEQRILDYIESTNPEASAAVAQMRDNWAKRSRMFEGMVEGSRTRTRESATAVDREFRNAYNTLEGATGRFLGQSNKLAQDFSGTTRDAARNIEQISQSGETQAALRQNLGDLPAEAITAAAQAQERSIRALGGLNREKAPNADTMDLGDLSTIALSLSPSAMIRTKAWALSRILQAAPKLPERRASELVNLLFSQDRAVNQKAIQMLNSAGTQGKAALNALRNGFAAGIATAPAAGAFEAPVKEDMQQPPADQAAPAPGMEDQVPAKEYSSYDEVLKDWESSADPQLVDLINRQFNQESGGQHFGPDGEPLESSAGALGVAQVMPETAPEAARLAGLEWDENAYRTDPAYNKLLGIAYMEEMLRKYDGDVELALAAYNAGPGAVDRAGGIPDYPETQDYVAKIAGGR